MFYFVIVIDMAEESVFTLGVISRLTLGMISEGKVMKQFGVIYCCPNQNPSYSVPYTDRRHKLVMYPG